MEKSSQISAKRVEIITKRAVITNVATTIAPLVIRLELVRLMEHGPHKQHLSAASKVSSDWKI